MAHPWRKSAICCGIDARTPLESTPKWIWSHFVPLRFRGQEAADETPATSHRRLHHASPQLGIQAARYGRWPPKVCHVPGAEGRALRDNRTGNGVGDAAQIG